MPRGGARLNSGPAPAAQSQKKDRAAARAAKTPGAKLQTQAINDGDWLTLPKDGRTGNAPAWPLARPSKSTVTSRRELAIWSKLWKLPQAVAWDLVGVDHHTIAMHVRTLVRAEQPDSPAGLTNTLRLQQDGLGLSAPGLRMLHWRIARTVSTSADAPAESHGSSGPRPTGLSPKERMRLVSGDGGR